MCMYACVLIHTHTHTPLSIPHLYRFGVAKEGLFSRLHEHALLCRKLGAINYNAIYG